MAFTIGAIALLLDNEPFDWVFMLIFAVLGIAPLIGGFLLLRRKPGDIGSKQCPNCGSTQHRQAGLLTSHLSVWLIPFVGWAVAALWGGSRKRQVQCSQCQTLYFSHTSASYVAGIILWIFLLFVLLGGIAYIFDIK